MPRHWLITLEVFATHHRHKIEFTTDIGPHVDGVGEAISTAKERAEEADMEIGSVKSVQLLPYNRI